MLIVREAGGMVEPLNPAGDILADGEIVCSNEALFNGFAKVARG